MSLRTVLTVVMTASLCVAAVAFVYPMYVIRPFRAQGASELQFALAIRSWAPWVSAACAAVAILAAFRLWRATRRTLARVFCLAAVGLTVGFAALAHVNVFELMFHRIDSPEAIAGAQAKLDPDDMVLAVAVAGDARAYPVRMMGYHHIANDWVGGEPVVATY